MATYFLLPVMAVCIAFYVYSIYRCRLRTRVVAKAVTSLVFLSISIISGWLGHADRSYFAFILVALFLCSFGDVFLEIAREDELGINYFVYSLSSFFLAHVSFLVAFCSIAGIYVLDFIYTGALVAILFLFSRLLKLDFFNMGYYVLCYAVVVSFMFIKSLSLIYLTNLASTRNWLVAVGAGLFLLSNFAFILAFRLEKKRRLHAFASCIYYTGQTLIALSVLFA